MVFEHGTEYDSQNQAIRSISGKFGMSAETLRLWVRRAETDEGLRPGLTTDERTRMKELERENRELRRVYRVKILGHFGPEIGVMPHALRWA
jgi:transposase